MPLAVITSYSIHYTKLYEWREFERDRADRSQLSDLGIELCGLLLMLRIRIISKNLYRFPKLSYCRHLVALRLIHMGKSYNFV